MNDFVQQVADLWAEQRAKHLARRFKLLNGLEEHDSPEEAAAALERLIEKTDAAMRGWRGFGDVMLFDTPAWDWDVVH